MADERARHEAEIVAIREVLEAKISSLEERLAYTTDLEPLRQEHRSTQHSITTGSFSKFLLLFSQTRITWPFVEKLKLKTH